MGPCSASHRWQCGSPGVLFARHRNRLYRTALAVLHKKEDAEDAVQNGLLQAYTSLRSFQGRSSFSTWLTRIVINSALMTRRKNSARPEASLEEILDSQPLRLARRVVDARPDPERACAAIEANALLEAHVRQLPSSLQAAFRLRAVNGLSARELSQVLGIRVSACKARFSRARRKLQGGLKQSAWGNPASSRLFSLGAGPRHCCRNRAATSRLGSNRNSNSGTLRMGDVRSQSWRACFKSLW